MPEMCVKTTGQKTKYNNPNCAVPNASTKPVTMPESSVTISGIRNSNITQANTPSAGPRTAPTHTALRSAAAYGGVSIKNTLLKFCFVLHKLSQFGFGFR